MTREEVLKIMPNASESTIRRNLALDRVEAPKPEPPPAPPLASRKPKRQRGKGPVVAIVSFISFHNRMLDRDNCVASLKPLQDAIAESLEVDDADERIRWEHGQCETRGDEGVIVKIEILTKDGEMEI